jgi:purine-binding chemotaxis protein CheW
MPQQFVIVIVTGRRRLVRLSDLREVVPLMALAEIEERRGLCRGIANLRGEIVPVFDLSGPDARLTPTRVILITRVADQVIGLVVDDVLDVITVQRDAVVQRAIGDSTFATIVRLGEDVLSVLEPADAIRDTR